MFLSDSLARYPVRAVTKPRDNKSDPNLETGTYGLFSTCQIKMRKSIVAKGVRYIIFVTSHRGERVLAGYYRIGWYAPGPDQDFALAAHRWRFVEPLPIGKQKPGLRAALELRRGYKGLNEAEASAVVDLLEAAPDFGDRYRGEIARLEALSLRHTGYRYPTWERKAGWSWKDSATYLADATSVGTEAVLNSAPGDAWVCGACQDQIVNKARLKRCPRCGALSTLRPLQKAA